MFILLKLMPQQEFGYKFRYISRNVTRKIVTNIMRRREENLFSLPSREVVHSLCFFSPEISFRVWKGLTLTSVI